MQWGGGAVGDMEAWSHGQCEPKAEVEVTESPRRQSRSCLRLSPLGANHRESKCTFRFRGSSIYDAVDETRY